jgi:hypothetical protein
MSDLLTQLIRQIRQARAPLSLELVDPQEGSHNIRDAGDSYVCRAWNLDRTRIKQMVEAVNAAGLLATEAERLATTLAHRESQLEEAGRIIARLAGAQEP